MPTTTISPPTEAAAEQDALAVLRHDVRIGLEAAAAGRFSTKTIGDIADEVEREYADPLAAVIIDLFNDTGERGLTRAPCERAAEKVAVRRSLKRRELVIDEGGV